MRKLFYTLPAALTAALMIASCESEPVPVAQASMQSDPRSKIENEYRLLKTELALAEAKLPYLVLDAVKLEAQIRLNGVIVWNEPLTIAPSDVSAFRAFVERARQSTEVPVLYLQDKKLFAAQSKFSDSVLTVVSTVLRVDQQLLQRELPAAFELEWNKELVLRFYTEADTMSKGGGAVEFLKDSWQTVSEFMKADIPKVEIPALRALTLFRVAHPGLPTLIVTEADIAPPEPVPSKGKKSS